MFFSNKTFINKIEGESVVPVISNLRHVVAIAVDVKRRHIYFSETHDEDYEQVIKRASIDGSDITDIISKDVGICEGLAVEWRAKLLYWTDASNKWIQVASLDGSQRKVLFSGNLSEPRGIAVDPTSGYVTFDSFRKYKNRTLVLHATARKNQFQALNNRVLLSKET